MIYNNAAWGSSFIICSQEGINGYPVATAADGNNGAVVWGRGAEGIDNVVQLIALVNGTWSPVVSEPVNTGTSPRTYDITVNSAGQVIAVWNDVANGVIVVMAAAGTI